VDPEVADLTAYRAVFLPDGCVPDAALSERIDAARAMGVKLVLSGTAGLDPATGQWLLKDVPVDYRGPAPTTPSYLRHEGADEVRTGLAPDYDYVFYETAHVVAPAAGARGVGSLRRARHDRTWRHFTSHSHAPVGESLDAPVAVVTPDLVYLAAPLLGAYPGTSTGSTGCWQRSCWTGCSASGCCGWTVRPGSRRPARGRTLPIASVVHLTAYQAGAARCPVPRVDEAGSIAGVTLSLRLGAAPAAVYLAPDRTPARAPDRRRERLLVRLPRSARTPSSSSSTRADGLPVSAHGSASSTSSASGCHRTGADRPASTRSRASSTELAHSSADIAGPRRKPRSSITASCARSGS
jgi:hypothetical protein